MSEKANSLQLDVKSEKFLVLLLSVLTLFASINTMMFNIALPDVISQLSLSTSSVSWIVVGYSFVFSVSAITYSRLSDFVPIRRLYIIGLILINVSSIAGFFSNSFFMLLSARLVQAAGGGIASLGFVLASRYIPLSRRGRAMAIVMAGFSLGLVIGPVIGGVVVEYLGWRYLFVVTTFTLISIPFFYLLIPRETIKQGSFDVLGALFFSIGVACLLLFITNPAWITLIIGFAAFLLFAFRIKKAPDPFVPPVLFTHKPYLTLCSVAFGAQFCTFATLFLMPQILIMQFDLSASVAGFMIFPGSLVTMILGPRFGTLIDRYGNRMILISSPKAVLISAILFALFLGSSSFALMLAFILMSLSYSVITNSVSNEITRILPASLLGSGLGLFNLLLPLSGAFGVAASASALEWQKQLPIQMAYANVYWGISVILLTSAACSYLYNRYQNKASQ